MKTRTLLRSSRIAAAILVLGVFGTVSAFGALPNDKLSTEEIIAKHLESIGTDNLRADLKTLTVVGKSHAVSKGRNAGETTGIVVMASDGEKNMIGMKFDNNDYPGEVLGYDGKDFTVGWQSPGQRSILGNFMLSNEKTFKSGILGGIISTGWELLNYNEDEGKLKCGGTSKIDGLKHHKCQYKPDGGSDLSITLYFHPENFRHVRTEYRRIISGGQGLSVDNSARQREVRYKLEENFSDFQEVGGLTLPHQYVISYEKQGGSESVDLEWRMDLADFKINLKIDSTGFKVDNVIS